MLKKLFFAILLGCLSIGLIIIINFRKTMRYASSQELFVTHVSPDGSWASVEGAQKAGLSIWNMRLNSVSKKLHGETSLFINYPWAPDSHAIALFTHDVMSTYNPQSRKLQALSPMSTDPKILISYNDPIVWSPNSRYLTIGVQRLDTSHTNVDITRELAVWDTVTQAVKCYPFVAQELSWVNNNTLFLIGFESTASTGKPHMALLNLSTQKIDILSIPYDNNIHKIGSMNVAPYLDANNNVICILHRFDEDILCEIDLSAKKLSFISRLEKQEDRDWNLNWSSSKRIYLTYNLDNGNKLLKVFYPSQMKISSTYKIHTPNSISIDQKGNVWIYRNGYFLHEDRID